MKRGDVTNVERVWLTTRDAMKYLGVSRDFLDNMRTSAKISFYVWGRTIFFRKDEIDRAIENGKVI